MAASGGKKPARPLSDLSLAQTHPEAPAHAEVISYFARATCLGTRRALRTCASSATRATASAFARASSATRVRCQIDPPTGTCVDAGNCNKCQTCVVDSTGSRYKCQAIVDKCQACEWCDGVTGACAPVTCSECNKCDPTANQCKPTPDVGCGPDSECNKCDATGRCAARENTTCTSLNVSV